MIVAGGGFGDLPPGAIEGDQGFGNAARIEMLRRLAVLHAKARDNQMLGGGMEVGAVFTRLGFRVDDGQANAYERRVQKLRVGSQKDIVQEARVDADTTGIDRYERKLRDADRQHGILAKGAGGARSAVGAIGRTAASTAGLLGAGGLAAGVALAGRELIGFDKAMRNVNSIAGLNEAQLAKMTDRVKDLAVESGQMPTTLAEGLYDLVSSGFDATESLLILKSTAKGATAGLTDTATSTKAVAAVLNAYHRPAKDAAKVTDDLFQTVNAGVVTFPELAQNIGDVLPFASALKVGLKEVGAATATMTKAGVSAPETMTRIKAVLSALISPSEKLKGAYDDLGVASGEELIAKTGSLQGALVALTKHVGDNKTAVAELFPDIRGLGGALLLTGENTKGAAKDLRGFKNDAGATQKALDEQSKSAAFGWMKAKAAIAAAVDDLQGVVAPAINEGSTAFSKFIQEARKGEGAGGRFADKAREWAGAIRDAAEPVIKVGGAIAGFVKRNPELAKSAAAFAVIGGAASKISKLTGAGGLLKFAFGRGNTPLAPMWVRVAGGPGLTPGVPGPGGGGGKPASKVPPWLGPGAAGVLPAVALQHFGALDKPVTSYGIPQTPNLSKLNRKLVLPGLGEDLLQKIGGPLKNAQRDLERFGDEVAKVEGRLSKIDSSELVRLRNRSRDLEEQFPKSARALRAFARDVDKELTFKGAVSQIANDWKRLEGNSETSLRDIRTLTRDEMRNIAGTLGKKSLEGKIALARNFQGAVGAIKSAMRNGTVSTQTGLAEIRRLMLAELALFGIKGAAARNYLSSSTGDTAGKGHGEGSKTTYATGGWVGRRGEAGADNVPILARDGDAFLNRHQLPFADAALAAGGLTVDHLMRRGRPGGGKATRVVAGRGEAHIPKESVPILDRLLRGRFGAGLDDLFHRVKRPHYLAGGGTIDRVTMQGGLGVLTDLGQKGLDRVRDAANEKLKGAADAAGPLGSGGETSTSGLVPQVRRAIAWARAHGWNGGIISGFRSDAEQVRIWLSGVRPAAKPRSLGGPGSNHSQGQAIDVSDPAGFGRAMQSAPPGIRLYARVPNDPVHFSVTGNAEGGIVEAFGKGGKKGKKTKVTSGVRAGEAPGSYERQNRGIERSIARAERGIAPYENRIQNLERDYGQMDRNFDRSQEVFLIENDDGSATVDQAAVDQRLAELDALKAKRQEIRDTIVKYRRAIDVALQKMFAEVGRLKAAIAASPGKARARRRQSYRDTLSELQSRMGELDGTYRDLGEDATDATIDLAELMDERGAVAGSSSRAAPPEKADASDASATAAPLTASDIATGVAEEIGRFNAGRSDLFTQFGYNAVPGRQAATLFSDPSVAAAGATYFGAFGDRPATTLQRDPTPEQRVQEAAGAAPRGIEIVNHFAEGPPDPHTWAQQQRFQIEGAIG